MKFFKKLKEFLGFKHKESGNEPKAEDVKQHNLESHKMYSRRFGGKIDGFADSDERRREKKHLKAYLRGDKFYTDGYKDSEPDKDGVTTRIPNWLPVEEEFVEVGFPHSKHHSHTISNSESR